MSQHEELDLDLMDCAKRAYEAINLHVLYGNRDDIKTKWLAVSLADGRSDNTLYDSAIEAADHQLHENQCWYVSFLGLSPAGFSVLDCAKMLNLYRQAAHHGFRFVDPDNRVVRGPLMTAAQNDYQDVLFKRDAVRRLGRIG